MMKDIGYKYLLAFTLCFCISFVAQSQSYLEKNRQIALSDRKQANENQTAYAKACVAAGDYFYKSKQYDSAVFYYERVYQIDDYIANNEVIKAQKMLDKKLGEIYFNGMPGVDKDRQKAFRHFIGNPRYNKISKKQAEQYSQKFFNIIKDTVYAVAGPDTTIIAINPFFGNEPSTFKKLEAHAAQLKGKEQHPFFHTTLYSGSVWQSSPERGGLSLLNLYMLRDLVYRLPFLKVEKNYFFEYEKAHSPFTLNEINWPVWKYVWKEDSN